MVFLDESTWSPNLIKTSVHQSYNSCSKYYSLLISMLKSLSRLPPRVPARCYSIKFSENFDGQLPEPRKPTLRDFRYPLFHTFLLASTTFMALNTLWYSLEYEQVELLLIERSKQLEAEMQQALSEAREDIQKTSKTWTSKLMFWKKST